MERWGGGGCQLGVKSVQRTLKSWIAGPLPVLHSILYSHLIPCLTGQEINQVIISKLSKAKNTVTISLISYEQYMVSFLEPSFAYLLTSFSSKFGGIKTEIFSFYLQSLGNNFSSSNSNKKGFDGTMRSLSNNKATGKSASTLRQQCTVKVTGLLADTSEDLLRNYFENKRRSKGGPVSSVHVDRERQECFIAFESSDGKFNPVDY